MTNRIFISRKRGVQLVAAGCPLDYLDLLPRSVPKHKPFRAEQIGGYSKVASMPLAQRKRDI